MKYQYTRSSAFPHLSGGLPLIEIALYHGGNEITVPALVDSGAAMSVLPYDTGLELGLVWEEQTVPVNVGGVLKDSNRSHPPLVPTLRRGNLIFAKAALILCFMVQRSPFPRRSAGTRSGGGVNGYERHFRIRSPVAWRDFSSSPGCAGVCVGTQVKQ